MSGGWGTPSWMGGDPVPGETYVNGKTPEMARTLLAAAKDLDLDPIVVRAVNGGFIVPDEVWDHIENAQADQPGGEF